MFQATIYAHIPEEFIQPIVSVMNQTCPKEIFSTFADTSPLNLSFKIQIVTNQDSTKLDDICEAPHLFIYFFKCSDKNDFLKNVYIHYIDYSKKNKRDYVPIMPIYINDSKKAKGKPKIFMQNSLLSYMQSEMPNLQTIDIKGKGFASKSGFDHLWPSIVGQVVQSISTKINTIRAQMQNQKVSFDTFRSAIHLCTLYDQISCFEKCFDVIDNVEKIISNNKEIFTFIDPKALTYRFDFCVGADNVEAKVFTEDPTEYDLRFIFLKRRIQALLCTEKNNEAITCAFNFFASMTNHVKAVENISEYMYCMWVAQALGDIITQCAKEKELNGSIDIPEYASMLEWYIRALPEARDKRVSFIGNGDPLQTQQTDDDDNSNQKAGKVGDFMILENILSKSDRFNAEISRNLLNLISYYSGIGYTRCAAIAMSKLAQFSADDDGQYALSAMITVIKKGCSHLIPSITENMILQIPFEERVYACCKIISDKQSNSREVAVNYLSKMLTNTDSDKTFRTSFNLPIRLTIYFNQEISNNISGNESNGENDNQNNVSNETHENVLNDLSQAFIQNEKASLRLKVSCDFPGHLKCNRLLVGFLNCHIVRIAYLECKDVEIYDGAIITVSNPIVKVGSYTIYNLKLMCGQDQVLNIILPSTREFIRVDPPPLPFDFSIEVPNFLLPRRWQLARLKIKVVRDVENLVFKIFGGVSYRPAALLLNNNEKRNPEKGLIFSNIPSGEHELNLQILPQTVTSGTLKIEADANVQTVVHEIGFKVSEFLELKLHYRKATNVAQLSAFVKSKIDLIVTATDFYEKESSTKIRSRNIGLPLNVGLSTSSALFFLESEPDLAKVWIKQNGMEEFAISLNVETFDEESMTGMKNDELTELSPLTPICPSDFSL